MGRGWVGIVAACSLVGGAPGPGAADPADPPAGPNSVGVSAALEMGVLFTTNTKESITVSRRVWDHLDLSAGARFSAGPNLVGHEEVAQVGFAVPISPRLGLLLAWRTGFAQFRVSVPDQSFWIESLSLAPVVAVDYRLTRELELRIGPLVPVFYWNRIWAMSVGPEVGISYRF